MATVSETLFQRVKPLLGWEARNRYRLWLCSQSAFLDSRLSFPTALPISEAALAGSMGS